MEARIGFADLARVQEIASVLVRYGFGDLIARLELTDALEVAGRAFKLTEAQELASLSPPTRVRRMMEELGPTFVKLGQVLATRVDLFGPEWIEQFERLQSKAPRLEFERLREQVEEDLGAPVGEVFAEFDEEPLGAASMAQVHRARLADGRQVVVKVRRPGIRRVIEADLRLLAQLAAIAQARLPQLAAYRPSATVEQFAKSLKRELDFAAEARSAERIAGSFEGDPTVVVPAVFWDWTGERLNVQALVEGIPGTDLEGIGPAGLDRRELARNGARAVLKMVLEDGYFHADPHPGNVLFLDGNRVAFIDYGMVGRLSEARRNQVVDLLHGLVAQDPQKVSEILLAFSGRDFHDSERLLQDIDAFIDRFHGVPLDRLSVGAMISQLTELLRDNDLTLPPDLSMGLKVFITLEGLGRQLDPQFDLTAELRTVVERATLARYAPDAMVRKGQRTISDLVEVLTELPRDLRRLLGAIRSGTIQHHVDVTHLGDLGARLDRAVNRLAVSLVTAALIVGTCIVIATGTGPEIFGVPLFEVLGVGAIAGGLSVLVSIWRSNRDRES